MKYAIICDKIVIEVIILIKKLTKMLVRDYDYELSDYTILQPNILRSKIYKPFLIIFALITIVFLLEVFGVIDINFNFILYFFAFAIFCAYPIANNKIYAKEVLIVTPELFIQRVGSKEFKLVEFDSITSFDFSEQEILIGQEEVELKLDLKAYEDHIAIVVEILESKGKTFDKEKDFMIRPVEIVCNGETIYVKDLKLKATKEEELTYKLSKKYDYVTPGYLGQILPKNAIIYDSFVKDGDLYLELNQLEVNGEHPENTTFGPIIVVNCVIVFENVKLKELAKREENTRKFPFADLELSLDVLTSELDKGVISEWRYSGKKATFVFAVGVGAVKATFDYKEVIVAWQKEK